MDIKLPLDVNLQPATSKAAANPLNLKLNQILSAKVIDTQIALDTLALKVGNKQVLVQPQQALNLQPGQSLQLQVSKLLPTPEFRLVGSAPGQNVAQSSDAPTLKLLKLLPEASINKSAALALNQLPAGQQLQASVVGNDGGKLTLLLTPMPSGLAADAGKAAANPGNWQVTLDAKQLLMTSDGNPATALSPKTAAPPLASLTPGTQIHLQVLKTGDSPTFAVTLTIADTEQKIADLFKQLLPIQAASPFLLNHLNRILPALENDATIAATLKRLAQEILNSIPLATQLTEATHLKQSVDQSGLFLESKLAQLLAGKDVADLGDDLKLKLSKFVQALTQEIEAQEQQKSAFDKLEMLKEALQKTHGTLAKLTLDQFQSLPKEDSAKLAWVLELPFFRDDQANTVQIEVERDKRGDQDQDHKNWAVSITITPPELATIHCRISCYDGSVNTRFWSDATDTVDKINTHLDHLKQQLEQKGLKTGFMEAHQGKPIQSDTVKKPLVNLLSERV